MLAQEDPSFEQTREEFAIKQLVSEAAVEALGEAVLPGATRCNEQRSGSTAGQPLSQSYGDHLGIAISQLVSDGRRLRS